MSDENSEKPDPIEDVRKGIGLLIRAAKSTLDQIPTRQIEDAVVSGAREVGRAIENVTGAIDKQLFRRDPASAPPETEVKEEPKPKPKPEDKGDAPPEEPKGPRVG
jgi:hypothetical protein